MKEQPSSLGKDLVGLEGLTSEQILMIIDTAEPFKEISERRIVMTATGKPYYFTTVGGSTNQLEVLPSPDSTYTASIVYYTRIAALTDAATSNWLLAAHPDIYLFGTLVEAEPYLKNDERMPMWTARLDKALNDLRLQGQRERHTASGLRMRSRVLG